MRLLQVKKGDFRFIPMALVMITILFPKVSFPHLAVLYFYGLPEMAETYRPWCPTFQGTDKGTFTQKFAGVGRDLEPQWFSSAWPGSSCVPRAV